MNQQLLARVVSYLKNDFDLKDKGDWLREGRCPSCNKKSLYTHAHTPWMVKCGRENNCAWEATIKELYPDEFENWSKRYPSTAQSPTAAADAYLESRGFDLSKLKGVYTQEFYKCPDTGHTSATVRFPLGDSGYWERLIDRPDRFDKKARFNYGGGYKGIVWQLSRPVPSQVSEVWIVEGIFDAIALNQSGVFAVSAMSCNNYPERYLEQLRSQYAEAKRKMPSLVWALDNDKAGRAWTRKHAKRAKESGWRSSARQLPEHKRIEDWNDALLAQRMSSDELYNFLKECKYHGDLLLSSTAAEYASVRYRHTSLPTFWFTFYNRLYWFNLNIERYQKAVENGTAPSNAIKESGALQELAACAPRALYQQSNAVTDESWYYFRVDFPHKGSSVKNTFTPGQVTNSSEWKKRLAHVAPGAIWTGTGKQLDTIMRDQLYNIKTVQTVNYIGYTKEHSAWVLGNYAVHNGKVFTLNNEDYFDFDHVSLKTLQRSFTLKIDNENFDHSWIDTFVGAFGPHGLVCLAYWFGSLFAEQIRGQMESFPFLEMMGEAGAGKTTIVMFLWKLFGRTDHEGFNPNMSTTSGRTRTFEQVSGMPVVLLEGDSDEKSHYKRFNYEELKPLFNGNTIRTTGVNTGGNETNTPSFRGTVVIEQNHPVDGSPALLSRIVQLYFTREGQSQETYQLATEIENWPTEQLSGFILKACQAEETILETFFQRYKEHEAVFQGNPGIREFRISQNHATICALIDSLTHVIPLRDEHKEAALNLVRKAAVDRQKALNADHPLVQEFWEAFYYLNNGYEGVLLDHSRDPNIIAINLNHFYELAHRQSQHMPPMNEMKQLLKNNKRHPFLGQKVVNSAIASTASGYKSMRCWLFKKEK